MGLKRLLLKEEMVKRVVLFIVSVVVSAWALGEEAVSRQELEELKARLERVEKSSAEDNWFANWEVAFSATAVLQASSGARKRLSPEGDVTDATLSTDLELLAPITLSGFAFAHFEAGSGDGLDGDIPTLSGFNDDADDDSNLRLTELWYEHRFLEERMALKVGKVDLTGPCGYHENSFDANAVANDECCQFLSSGFVNSLAVEFPDDNSFGVVLWGAPHKLLQVGLGIADADADWDNVFDNTFAIAELDFSPEVGGRPGNYRFYLWLNDKDHTETKDPTKTREEGSGFGVSFDQELTDVISASARFARQRERVYPVEYAWSVGLQLAGSFYGREGDVLGVAYGQAKLGGDQRDVNRLLGIRTGDEDHVEAYCRLRINDNLALSPDIQWLNNPDGDRDNDDVWAFGVRAQLDF